MLFWSFRAAWGSLCNVAGIFMKYSSYIDNITSKEWGFSIQLAYIFDWLYSLPSWAEAVHSDEGTFFFASRHKAIEELPLLTDKPDTIYRYYKELEVAGFIEMHKFNGKDYIKLTEKTRQWGRKIIRDSDLNPDLFGNKSEKGSENNPTYKNTNTDKNTRDKNTTPLPFDSLEFHRAWTEWFAYRKEIKKKMTETTIRKQFKDLAAHTEADAIQIIEQSIRNGWTGLHPLKTFEKKQSAETDAKGNPLPKHLIGFVQ